jgi:hypothetical protein
MTDDARMRAMRQDGTSWQAPGDHAGVTTTGRLAPGAALVDVAAAGGVDLDRLERALALRAGRIGPGRYRVSGGAQDHWVDLASPAHPRCDCGDHTWREQVCKHILAALLREGDPRVVQALAAVTTRLHERLRAAQAAAGDAARAARADRPAARRAA